MSLDKFLSLDHLDFSENRWKKAWSNGQEENENKERHKIQISSVNSKNI